MRNSPESLSWTAAAPTFLSTTSCRSTSCQRVWTFFESWRAHATKYVLAYRPFHSGSSSDASSVLLVGWQGAKPYIEESEIEFFRIPLSEILAGGGEFSALLIPVILTRM